MTDQLDLFSSSSCDFEEEQKKKIHQQEVAKKVEMIRQEREDFLTKNLTTRQHRLVDYLKANFVKGKYFTIEEICSANLGYTLNTNPRIHDKCAMLSSDIRAINWAIGSHYSIIVKDKKGSCKLCESKDEFDEWKQGEKDKIEKKYQYLNTLTYKASLDDTMAIVNLNDKAIEGEFIEVFKGNKDE